MPGELWDDATEWRGGSVMLLTVIKAFISTGHLSE